MNTNIPLIKNYLSSKPVLKAYIFGSVARGDDDEKSDLDLLLELDNNASLFDMALIQVELEKLLGIKVDVVSANGLSPNLKPYIDKDKKLIYER